MKKKVKKESQKKKELTTVDPEMKRRMENEGHMILFLVVSHNSLYIRGLVGLSVCRSVRPSVCP